MGLEINNGYGLPSQQGLQRSQRANGFGAFTHNSASTGEDSFSRLNGKPGQEHDGRFSISRAAKNFMKGVISPVTSILQHPGKALAMLAGTVALATVAPVTIPLMLIGFTGLSAFQAGKGVLQAASRYSAGDMAGAEQAFESIGAGTVGVGLSALGVRSSAAVAAETQATAQAIKGGANLAQATKAGMEASAGTRSLSFWQAIGKNLDLVRTGDGWRAVGYGLKPGTIAMNTRMTVARGKQMVESFKQRRELRNMTDEQIHTRVLDDYNQAWDAQGIPQELRPPLKPFKSETPGNYLDFHADEFAQYVDLDAYRQGKLLFRNKDAFHESVHHVRSLQEARLYREDPALFRKTVEEQMLANIRRGEQGPIRRDITGQLGPDGELQSIAKNNMDAPQMSPDLRGNLADLYSRRDVLTETEAKAWKGLFDRQAQLRESRSQLQNLPEGDSVLRQKLTGNIQQLEGDIANAHGIGIKSVDDLAALGNDIKGLFTNLPEAEQSAMAEILMDYTRAQVFRAQHHASRPESLLNNPAIRNNLEKFNGGTAKDWANVVRERVQHPDTGSQQFFAYFSSPEEVAARNAAAEARKAQAGAEINQLAEAKDAADLVRLRSLHREKMAAEAEININNASKKMSEMAPRRRDIQDTPETGRSQQDRDFLQQFDDALKTVGDNLPAADNPAVQSAYREDFPFSARRIGFNRRATARGTELPLNFNSAFLPHFTNGQKPESQDR